jgi:hypothetical protein
MQQVGTLYPRFLGESLEISENKFVSRSTVSSDSHAVLEVRPEAQSPSGVPLDQFLNDKDRYVRVDHKASIGSNFRAAGQQLKVGAMGGALLNVVDAVSHAVQVGLRR